jgi:hypothetical protein
MKEAGHIYGLIPLGHVRAPHLIVLLETARFRKAL